MISWLLLAVSLVGAGLTLNVLRPAYAPGRRAALSFLGGWLTAELALHHIAWQAAATLGFVWAGALRTAPGRLGAWTAVASWVTLCVTYFRGAAAARPAMETALVQALGADYRRRIRPELAAALRAGVDWRRIARPFPMRHPDVERIRGIAYERVSGVDLRLDVYRRRSRPQHCPVLFEIHGGAWVVGSKNEQGIPLMLRLAAQGWVCVAADYRLSPHATFPDHLVDLKKALAWIRAHVAEYGGDPDFVVVAGQSAGGHLASLVALTANQSEYQPGFEAVNTSVAGCLSFYGVYDFTDRHGLWPNSALARVLEQKVMKAALADDRAAYEKASPMSRIHAGAPPFLIVHGDLDTLVPVAEARRFAADLRAETRAPVAYAELRGAQHAFDIFPSLRGELALAGVERFVAVLHGEYLDARQPCAASAAG